ncbi:MAG: M48 family metalloprotease [Chloroflexi bacterium]|nr:M48 family metalloprotease [Chloroflexota bacterium]
MTTSSAPPRTPVSARHFVHPEDKAALDNLRSIPLFTPAVQGFMKLLPERLLHGLNMAQKVRLGPEQLPHVYRYLPVACERLGIAEPEFYLEMNPRPNAYTYGDQRSFVTVTSGLIEHLNEEEVQAVVAHECGHIACRHTLYHTMALLLLQFGASIFGPLAALSLPLQLALLYWHRRSEFSADRAAAVVMGSAQPVVDTMIRFAGGPKSITGAINLELYMQQAEAYDKLMDSQWDQLLQGLATAGDTHPLLSVRTREIVKWCDGEQFRRLMHGDAHAAAPTEDGRSNGASSEAGSSAAAPDASRRCPSCGETLKETWKFCGFCGAPIAVADGAV